MTMTMRQLIEAVTPLTPDELRQRAMAHQAALQSATMASEAPALPPLTEDQLIFRIAIRFGIADLAARRLVLQGVPLAAHIRTLRVSSGQSGRRYTAQHPLVYRGNGRSKAYPSVRLARLCGLGDSRIEYRLCRRLLRGASLADLALA